MLQIRCRSLHLSLLLIVAAAFTYSNAANRTSIKAAAVQCNRQLDTCRCETTSGGQIDLSPLAKSDGKFAFANVNGPSGQFFYFYNPCNAVLCNGNNDAAACQRSVNGKDEYVLGTQSSAKFSTDPTLGLILTYSAISGDKLPREAQLQLICDTSGSDVSLFLALTDGSNTQPYVYKMSLMSKYCCEVSPAPSGGGGGLSGGEILLIVFFSLAFAYLAVGLGVNLLIRKRSGREAVPNLTFWIALPGLVKEGASFTFGKIKGTISKNKGDYQHM